MMTADEVKKMLQKYAEAERAAFMPGFFKATPGGYGEGDLFLGVRVPMQRKVAAIVWKDISRQELVTLLRNTYHECRLTALFILIRQFEKTNDADKKQSLVDCYISNLDYVNNWDLVDSSAYQILGVHLFRRERSMLYKLADSGHLWRQRISVVSTWHFIRMGEFDDTLRLSIMFLEHPHDLMHKACGWMIREIGKRDFEVAYNFLIENYLKMPRTMLRYAIEKFPESMRKDFLQGRL